MIEVEDLKNLVIEKKLVHIENTNLYSEEAYQYLKNLVDANRALIFEKNTHRIYTMGQYYGGDEFKENLLYFSKILSIDINDEIISEIDIIKNEDTLAFKAKDNISLNIERKNDYTEIEIGYDLNNIVDKTIVSINNNDYNLDIEQGKLKFKEYIQPNIYIEDFDLTYEGLDSNNEKEIELLINTPIPVKDFVKFEISVDNCTFINFSKNKLILKVTKDNNPIISIAYDDGIKENQITFIIEWKIYCYYGIINENLIFETMQELGKYDIKNNSIDQLITIDQQSNYYAYYMCPVGSYNPYFIDNDSKIQGAWHRIGFIEKNLVEYIIYITDNSGLGKINWEIKNKN